MGESRVPELLYRSGEAIQLAQVTTWLAARLRVLIGDVLHVLGHELQHVIILLEKSIVLGLPEVVIAVLLVHDRVDDILIQRHDHQHKYFALLNLHHELATYQGNVALRHLIVRVFEDLAQEVLVFQVSLHAFEMHKRLEERLAVNLAFFVIHVFELNVKVCCRVLITGAL